MRRLTWFILGLAIFLGTGTAAREVEWPEGWSAAETINQYSIFSQRYDVEFNRKKDQFVVAGIKGSRGAMHLILDIFEAGITPRKKDRLLVRENSSFIDFPRVFIDSSGNFLLLWVEKVNRIRHIYFQKMDEEGNFIGERVIILESPRRISNVRGFLDEKDRVHLNWTGLGETGLEIHYSRVGPGGEIELEPTALTSSEKFSYRGLILSDGEKLHLFWVELLQFSADLQYQQFNLEGDPLGSSQTIAHVSLVDRAGFPFLEISMDGVLDERGEIHLIWNAQGDGDDLFRSGSDIFYSRFRDGKMVVEPQNLIAYWADAHFPVIAMAGNKIKIAWEDHLRTPVRIAYQSWGKNQEGPIEPVYLNYGVNSGFSPHILIDGEGWAHVFWYNFFQDRNIIEVKAINHRYPGSPSFWYQLGLGTENPLQRLLYVLGLNFLLALLNSLTQLHFIIIVISMLALAGNYLDLKKFAWGVIFTGFALIFLLQETGWYYQPLYLESGFEFLSSALAALLVYVFLRAFSDWPGIKDAMGQFIVFWLFVYWQTFFSFIPHYINEIIP